MAIQWAHSIESVDWNEMSELYRIAPLGTKSGKWLKTAYQTACSSVLHSKATGLSLPDAL